MLYKEVGPDVWSAYMTDLLKIDKNIVKSDEQAVGIYPARSKIDKRLTKE